MLYAFRDKLLDIPQKVVPMLIGEDDSTVIVSILEKELYEALDQLSEYDPLKIDEEEGTMFEDDEDEEDE